MSQAVVIKSNKYGINLVLDKTMPFRELLVAIKEKFLESCLLYTSPSPRDCD